MHLHIKTFTLAEILLVVLLTLEEIPVSMSKEDKLFDIFKTKNSSRECLADQYTNGCSVPLGIAAPYKGRFTPACNKHDICYGCGHHFKWTRDLCDDAFLADMKTTCKQLFSHVRRRRFLSALLEVWYFFQGISKEERRCKLFADMYYKVVRTFGKSHFEIRDNDYCWSTCADKHGSPYEDLSQDLLF